MARRPKITGDCSLMSSPANNDTISQLLEAFAAASNTANAQSMAAYMKNKFVFFGIKSVERRTITQPFVQVLKKEKINPDLITQLWEQPQREVHYFAVDLLYTWRKQYTTTHFVLFQKLITRHSWWDTVDALAGNVVGTWAKGDWPQRKNMLATWIHDENMWLNRSAIICQLKFGLQTDTDFLKNALQAHLLSTEFFHRKAIGWALRQYSKYHPEWVADFVAQHPEMSGLSKREATKFLA